VGGRPLECEEVRQDLCRLAVDAATGAPVALLARHARRCDGCAAYVNSVAHARRWLELGLRALAPADTRPEALEARARAALARELAARLARDLQDLGLGEEARPVGERRRDLQRLELLRGPLERDPWPVASRLVGASRPINRRLALRLASRLDPVGLDVAVAHLQALERTGRGALAHAETERLLGLLG
jgi:hypothetical protein